MSAFGKSRDRRGLAAVLLLAGLLLFPGDSPRASSLVADLSQHLVAITTGFVGTNVLLFGAVDSGGDVAVVVRGPVRDLTMHRKNRVLGVWVNTASMVFRQVPSFYALATSRPLEEIAPASVLARQEIGVENLRLRLPRAKVSPNLAKEWREGLIRNQQARGLYPLEPQTVTFLGNRLFRTTLHLPANVPTGTYQVDVFLLKEGRILSAQTTPLLVSKVGTEAWIFEFAHQYSALYGLVAIALALVAGWLGHLAFRKV